MVKSGDQLKRDCKWVFFEFQKLKSRDFLNVGKNVQNTPFGTLTSDNTYVCSDTVNISFSAFVRLMR